MTYYYLYVRGNPIYKLASNLLTGRKIHIYCDISIKVKVAYIWEVLSGSVDGLDLDGPESSS